MFNRRDTWILHSGNIQLDELPEKSINGKCICSKHFAPSEVYYDKKGTPKLKVTAIPIDYVIATDPEADNDEMLHEPPLLFENVEPMVVELNESGTSQNISNSFEHNNNTLNSSNFNLANQPSNSSFLNSENNIDCSNNTTLSSNNLSNEEQISDLKAQVELLTKQLQKQQKELNCKKASEVKLNVLQNRNNKIIKTLQTLNKKKQKKIENLKKYVDKAKEAIKFEKQVKKMDAENLEFFTMQLNHVKQKPWRDNEKEFSIKLFYKSPRAYCYLRDKVNFKLPCLSKIRRWVNELNLQPGRCDTLLNLLKNKTSLMSEKERECVLTWDEMSIKEGLHYNVKYDFIEGFTDLGEHGRTCAMGNHILVFMIRGRQTDWRQPIAYYVAKNSVPGKLLHKIILEVLDYVEEAGFTVKSMVCDLGTPNQAAVKALKITKDNPYILRFNRKIFFNFDPPHLIKCLRNNLMKRQMKVGEHTVSWGPIIELRKTEENLPVKLAPKLTDRHVFPNKFQLMNVSLATQVFSNEVSKALLVGKFTNTGSFRHPDTLATGNLLKNGNDILDCMNARSARDRNPLKKGLSNKDPRALNFLKNKLEYIKSWEVTDGKPKPACFDGFYLSVNSMILQWEKMEKEGAHYLLTSRLNQDPCENLFASIRERSGHNLNPTAQQSRQNLQYNITANLMSTSKLKNCTADGTVALLAASDVNLNSGLQESIDDELVDKANDYDDDTINMKEPENDDDVVNEIYNEVINNLVESSSSAGSDDSISSDITCKEMESEDELEDLEPEVNACITDDQDLCLDFSNETSDDTSCTNLLSHETHVSEVASQNVSEVMPANDDCESVNQRNIFENESDRVNSITLNPNELFSSLQVTIKYVAGYILYKCLKKSKCQICKTNFVRENSNFENCSDLLIFFKAYKCQNGNELGNLCVPKDEFTEIITTAINVFHNNFLIVCAEIGIAKILNTKIVEAINSNHSSFFDVNEPCKSHRETIVKFIVRVHIFTKLKWINSDHRDQKRSKIKETASNKPDAKLRKVRHE